MAGRVIKFEVINIPWTDQLVNYTSDVFRNAKYIVEEAVSILQPKSIKICFEIPTIKIIFV